MFTLLFVIKQSVIYAYLDSVYVKDECIQQLTVFLEMWFKTLTVD